MIAQKFDRATVDSIGLNNRSDAMEIPQFMERPFQAAVFNKEQLLLIY